MIGTGSEERFWSCDSIEWVSWRLFSSDCSIESTSLANDLLQGCLEIDASWRPREAVRVIRLGANQEHCYLAAE